MDSRSSQFFSARGILACVLAGVCGVAVAGWEQYDQDDKGTDYIDKSSIRKKGDLLTVWTLFDADIPTPVRENVYTHSSRVQTEFNCSEKRARTLVHVKYEERMASGRVVQVKEYTDDWSPVTPTIGRMKILKIVCTKQ